LDDEVRYGFVDVASVFSDITVVGSAKKEGGIDRNRFVEISFINIAIQIFRVSDCVSLVAGVGYGWESHHFRSDGVPSCGIDEY
jgi:hypothetical protein